MSIAIGSLSTPAVTGEFKELSGRTIVLTTVGGAGTVLTEHDGVAIAAAARMARKSEVPFCAIISTEGASTEHGAAAAHGWAQAAHELSKCSGTIPILIGVPGPLVSSVALLLGLSDINVFTTASVAFVSGPKMAEMFTGNQVSATDLGGFDVHQRTTGVATCVVDSAEQIIDCFSDYLEFLPDSVNSLPMVIETHDATDRQTPEAGDIIPDSPTGSYDVRKVIESICDDGYFLESNGPWASNLVTGFARFGGLPVGIVANQPQNLAGAIDIPASQKGAAFVSLCDSFGISLLTLVDTSGFLPGKDLEWRGMIRHGAQLAFAYARATVPRIGLILRKSYGGAYIVMDSRYMGNDLMFAWPTAEVAVMGAKGAVGILHRKATPEEKEKLVKQYEDKYLTPYPAAERGSIASVIEPAETRKQIVDGFDLLNSKREKLRPRKHDNSPL